MPLRCALFGHGLDDISISGLQTLKYKESDRVSSLNLELNKITSNNKNIDTYSDHRIAMSIAPLCLKYEELIIYDAEVVSKSYRRYWNDLKTAGFIISS